MRGVAILVMKQNRNLRYPLKPFVQEIKLNEFLLNSVLLGHAIHMSKWADKFILS